jgi:hypothetical protein
MSEPADIATRTQRFNEAVRTFTPASPSRHAKLMPFKDGIVELRQKGGSFRLIRELLATINVAVGTDTIARFLAEVNGVSASQPSSKRRNRVRYGASGRTPGQPAAVPAARGSAPEQSPPPQPSSSTPFVAPPTTSAIERPRTRGPRIADPSNL